MATVATRLPLENTTTSGQADGLQGGAQIEDQYVAKPPSHLPIPHVYLETQLAEIKKSSGEDLKLWIKHYATAKSLQAEQDKILQKLNKAENERQQDFAAFNVSIRKFREGASRSITGLLSEFEEQRDKLEELNAEISSANTSAGRDEDFGLVREYSLLEPKLNNQGDFQSKVVGDPLLQSLLAKHYHMAFRLQHYHLAYVQTTWDNEKRHNPKIERAIIDGLDSINDSISAETKRLYKSRGENSEICCLVYVPTEGQNDYTLTDLEEEEDSDDEGADSDTEIDTGPHIEQPGDGPNGQSEKPQLPKVVYDIRARMGGRDGPLFTYVTAKLNNTEDLAAKTELESLAREVDAFCDAKGINRATYAIKFNHIDAFQGMVEEAMKSLESLKANLNDTSLHNEYRNLRARAALFIQEHQWPDAFLDTFVPSEAEILALITGKTMNPPPNPTPGIEDPKVSEAPPGIEDPKVSEAPPGIEDPEVAEAPPGIEDTDDQCIQSVARPGEVEELEDGVMRRKIVAGFRKNGFGSQLLLKSHATNPKFKGKRFIFELVPAKGFSGVLEEYKAMHGDQPIKTVARSDLKDRPWRQALIGGVASIRRKDDKNYKIQAVTLVNIKFPGTAFMWASRSNLKNEFGELGVKAKIDQYMMESGQKPPKAPTERVFRRSKKEPEAQENFENSEDTKRRRKKATKPKTGSVVEEVTGMTRTRHYKRKPRQKFDHPKTRTSFPETDGEEEGESLNDASDRSGDESEAGSIKEFIIHDDAVEVTQEDIDKIKAQLELMMTKVKKS